MLPVSLPRCPSSHSCCRALRGRRAIAVRVHCARRCPCSVAGVPGCSAADGPYVTASGRAPHAPVPASLYGRAALPAVVVLRALRGRRGPQGGRAARPPRVRVSVCVGSGACHNARGNALGIQPRAPRGGGGGYGDTDTPRPQRNGAAPPWPYRRHCTMKGTARRAGVPPCDILKPTQRRARRWVVWLVPGA